jgi:hypothetical protein
MDSEDKDLLIPDIYAYEASFQQPDHKNHTTLLAFQAAWLKRQEMMFWCGATTGIKQSCPIGSMAEFIANDQVQTCQIFQGLKQFDIKISRIVQVDDSIVTQAREWLEQHQCLATEIDESDFTNYRHYPDLAGNGLAWGTIYKHLCRSLIFRPESKRKLRYHTLMLPWKHYIPVNADLSDLQERHEWACINAEQACLIAWRGRETVLHYLNHLNDHFSAAVVTEVELL